MRYVIVAALVLFLLPVAGIGGVYAVSELKLRSVEQGPPFDVAIPADQASIERGRHIARTRGCFGCHGQQLQGSEFSEEWPWVKMAVAPNLAKHAREHSPAVIEAAVRQGIGHNGKALWSMPSYNWVHLTDADMAALIAFLSTADIVEAELPKPALGITARWEIASGVEKNMAEWAAMVPPLSQPEDPALRHGEYLAMTMCNECHGLDLRGAGLPDALTPDLAILAAYSDGDFRTLMREGMAIGGRDNLPLMSMVARDRFASLTDEERANLLAFLRTLPGKPVPPDVYWRSY